MIDAVVFDLDGVLIDSEQLWDRARRDTVSEHRRQWPEGATEAMQGMSSTEWSAYMKDRAHLDITPGEIVDSVVERLMAYYRSGLPLLPGAVEAVRRMAARWPLALASSSNRVVIDGALQLAGLSEAFSATVSSEEVSRGKPAPDVYREAARRIHTRASHCAAIEDSTNGIRSASSAAMCVVAIPNPHYPPSADALAIADTVLSGLDELTVEAVLRAEQHRSNRIETRIDEQELESFPASDAHADWAGPG